MGGIGSGAKPKYDRQALIALKASGLTYKQIAEQIGTTSQNVQQILSPSPSMKRIIKLRADYQCEKCFVPLGERGHFHHIDYAAVENFNSPSNLQYLCGSCHMQSHSHVKIFQIKKHREKPPTHDLALSMQGEYVIPIRGKRRGIKRIFRYCFRCFNVWYSSGEKRPNKCPLCNNPNWDRDYEVEVLHDTGPMHLGYHTRPKPQSTEFVQGMVFYVGGYHPEVAQQEAGGSPSNGQLDPL